MNYNLENMKDLIGTLITADDKAVVQDVFIEIDPTSARKLAAVLRSNRVTRENQDLHFKSISINKNSAEVFKKGQSGLIKDGDRYIMTTTSRNPVRFKGILQTLVRGSDGKDYACNIEIGSIDFNLDDARENQTDDIVLFENVYGTIYPYGKYQAVIEQD